MSEAVPTESPMDEARFTQRDVSERLGDDGGIDTMTLTGPTGLHAYIGHGSALEYQANVALLAAMNDWLDETVWVHDPEDHQDAQEQIQRDLSEHLDTWTAEHIAEQTAEVLANWSDYHGQEMDRISPGERLDHIRAQLHRLSDEDEVADYAAGDYVDEALNALDAAAVDLGGADDE